MSQWKGWHSHWTSNHQRTGAPHNPIVQERLPWARKDHGGSTSGAKRGQGVDLFFLRCDWRAKSKRVRPPSDVSWFINPLTIDMIRYDISPKRRVKLVINQLGYFLNGGLALWLRNIADFRQVAVSSKMPRVVRITAYDNMALNSRGARWVVGYQ